MAVWVGRDEEREPVIILMLFDIVLNSTEKYSVKFSKIVHHRIDFCGENDIYTKRGELKKNQSN